MYDGHKMAFHLTVGTIEKIWLENHLRLLLRFDILFSGPRQEQETHNPKTEEKNKN